ncbi:hypothetical protein V1264_006902 [Littorina saxatilis]|uniref:Uncharacterized protein n=1 Tax=Littorina saxatilis TaxID=31220 RepID=A0AAN9AY30_9CAEN
MEYFFEEDVRINEDCERKKSLVTEDSADKSVSAGSGFVNATTEQSVTTSAKLSENTLAELKQLMIMITIGVPVSIFVILLVILLVFKRSLGRRLNATRPTQGLPPPPAPHTFRRHVLDDVVMFHAQGPPHVQRDSDSFVSGRGHIYERFPDEPSTSDNSNVSIDSMSGSDSSLWDTFLHHIACPSSDSSLGSLEALMVTTSAPDPSQTSSPGSQSTLPEDYLHPITSPTEAATTRSPSATTSSHTMESPLAQHSFPNDYLHPIASSKAAAIATTTATTASETPSVRSIQNLEAAVGTSSKRNRQNSPRSKSHKNLPKDYLHPIVSS